MLMYYIGNNMRDNIVYIVQTTAYGKKVNEHKLKVTVLKEVVCLNQIISRAISILIYI